MSETSEISCPSLFTIQSVEEFKAVLDPHIAELKDLVLDASNVEKVDSCGLQLLVAAKDKLQQGGASMKIHSPSEVVLKISRILGLEKDLEITASA